jgi:hypothetical protein
MLLGPVAQDYDQGNKVTDVAGFVGGFMKRFKG